MTYPSGNPQPPFGYGPDAATAAFHAARQKSRRRLTIILSAIVAVLVVAVGVGGYAMYRSAKGEPLIPALALRSSDDPGPDPFTRPVQLTNRQVSSDSARRGEGELGVRAVSGTEPGLYGTTGSAACDTAALGNSLANDPAAGNAWAGVFGIRRIDIPWYLNTLTPVVLTADTWVTNHAYRSGVASPFQSVLQAGAAVYVDAAGVPRAVCTCGNPLLPPAAAPVGGYRVVGHPWPTYRTTNVQRVSYTVNNTTNNTTVVPSTPAGLTELQVRNIVTDMIEALRVGDLLENLGPAPADQHLPDPFTSNVAPSFTGDAAAENGLRDGSPEAAPAVLSAARDNNGVPAVEEQAGEQQSAVDPSSTASASSESTEASESSAAPTPTDFGSSTGDAIGSLTFSDDGHDVTCTLPPTFSSSQVVATCDDGGAREFAAADLMESAVTQIVAASADRVWTVSTVAGQTLTVTSASWQTLVPETTQETTTAPETTDETAPDTTAAETASGTPETTDSPSAEAE